MNIWFYIGIGLLLWVIWDFFSGITWSYREIKREEEPEQYWFFTILWLILAVSAILAGFY